MYNKVHLIPKLSSLQTRAHANTSVIFAKSIWNTPVIPANMKCVIDFDMAEKLIDNNHFYILHRFYNQKDIIDWVQSYSIRKKNSYISLSVGVKEDDIEMLKKIRDNGNYVDCVTIDIAHGHSILVKNTINNIRNIFKDTFIIAGNVATADGVEFLTDCGADAVKVGISMGASCITYNKTGFGVPQFTSILTCSENSGIPIIGDGGIRENGDITKALVAGATMVMVGGMFASLSDSPSDIIETSSGMKKIYYGSASEFTKGHRRNIEGKRIEIEYNPMTYLEKYEEIKEDLQSAISYGGGIDLSCFNSVEYGYL